MAFDSKGTTVNTFEIPPCTEPAPTANWKDCPVCYQQYDYSRNNYDPNLVPRLLSCGHLVCSLCAAELWHDSELTCPSCLKTIVFHSIEELPVPMASPLCSPISNSSRQSDTVSNTSESRRRQGSETDNITPSSSPGGSPSLLKEFMNTSGGANHSPSKIYSDDATHEANSIPNYLICLMRGCRRKRCAGRYFCEIHQDKAQRLTWRSTESLVQRYKDFNMSTGIVDQSGRITGEVAPEPSLETLSPAKLASSFRAQNMLTMGEALWLIDQASDLLSLEPNVLTLKAPIRVVGDLHGQFFDLLSMLEMCGLPVDDDSDDVPGYLFLGDYVDRGAYSCEVMLYLISLKLAFPKHIHLLRGNHECRSLTGHFGFKDECMTKYGLPVYFRFLKMFQQLPLTALITNSHGRYLCAHGGLSPSIHSMDEVNLLQRKDEPPMNGPLCDILWADPADDPGYCNTPQQMSPIELETLLGGFFVPNHLRGCSVSFGYAAALEFLEANNLLCLIRAHAVQENGYYRHFEDAVNRIQREDGEDAEAIMHHKEPLPVFKPRLLPAVITVFSAPNYCGRYGNRGAILTMEWDKLEPTVLQYDCVPAPSPRAGAPSRANVHLTALIEACPYMPSTFRDFVIIAGRMGPAQPLQGSKTSAAATAAHEVCSSMKEGSTVAQTTAKFEARARMGAGLRADSFAAAVGASSNSEDGPSTTHVMYQAMAANDRINERHPEALFANAEQKRPSYSRSSSTFYPKVSVKALMKRFEPKREQSEVESSSQLDSEERRTHRRKSTSILSRAELYQAAAMGKSEPSTPVITNQTKSAQSSTPRQFFPGSWVSVLAPWRHYSSKTSTESEGVTASKAPASTTQEYTETSSGLKQLLSVKISSPSSNLDHNDMDAPKPRSYTATEAHKHNNRVAECFSQSNSAAKTTRQYMLTGGFFPSSVSAAVCTPWGSLGSNWKNQHKDSQEVVGGGRDTPAQRAHGRRFSDGYQGFRLDRLCSDGEVLRLRKMDLTASHRRSQDSDEFAFSQAEMLGLKLLFALMDHGDTQYIDAKALELYAGEHDDYAQVSEVEACIEAVDVDNDGKIGLMDFLSFAARLKLFYEMSLKSDKEDASRESAELSRTNSESQKLGMPTFLRNYDRRGGIENISAST